jgi:hypothetical protein
MRVARWILASGLIVAAAPLFAQTVAVGNCQPKKTSFPTIQQALNATPPGANHRCLSRASPRTDIGLPGSDPEGASHRGIRVPRLLAFQMEVWRRTRRAWPQARPSQRKYWCRAQPASPLPTSRLTAPTTASTGCGLDPIGIYYQNSSGTISHDSILNEVLGAGLTGCQAGLGIFANFQKNGITGNEVGTSVTITANDVIGQGPTNGAAENAPRGSQQPN